MGPAFVEGLPVAKFHGVGPVTAAKMERLGIRTGADLRSKPPSFLQQHFGKAGCLVSSNRPGRRRRPVVANRPRKSSGSETTFQEDLTDPKAVEAGLLAMADDVWAWCRNARRSAGR